MALSDDPQHIAALPGGGGVLGDVADGLAQLAERANKRKFAGTSHKLIAPGRP
jgi:benzoylformate decarboxylase